MTLYGLLELFGAEGENDDFAASFSEICKIWRFLPDDFLRYVKNGRGNGAKSDVMQKVGKERFCWMISGRIGTRRFCNMIF